MLQSSPFCFLRPSSNVTCSISHSHARFPNPFQTKTLPKNHKEIPIPITQRTFVATSQLYLSQSSSFSSSSLSSSSSLFSFSLFTSSLPNSTGGLSRSTNSTEESLSSLSVLRHFRSGMSKCSYECSNCLRSSASYFTLSSTTGALVGSTSTIFTWAAIWHTKSALTLLNRSSWTVLG